MGTPLAIRPNNSIVGQFIDIQVLIYQNCYTPVIRQYRAHLFVKQYTDSDTLDDVTIGWDTDPVTAGSNFMPSVMLEYEVT